MTVSSSPAISALIKGMFTVRPPSRELVPEWDLPLVLQYLASEEYEPLQTLSLLKLSMKTAFLVAVACGRRCSEIQALAIDETHLQFSRAGVSILPRAGFLAKNQTLAFSPRPVFLPDLVRSAGSSEKPWCPVRALKTYIRRTKDLRGKENHLFITSEAPYRAAARSTISRWIITVIRSALNSHQSRMTGTRIRAHDTRSQTSSWALYGGVALQDILDAAGWAVPTTFQSVYLKDVLATRGGVATAALTAGRHAPIGKH